MKVLVTGSNGFVGKNLISTLSYLDDIEVLAYSRADSLETLVTYTKNCDFVIHLAGVNRSENTDDFFDVNKDLTNTIVKLLEKHNNIVPILVSSSIQASLDNVYGQSKKAGEDIIIDYSKRNDVEVLIYRFSNIFGKWSKPNYNSVVATWCYNVANNKEIIINNEEHVLTLVYIDDIVEDIINKIVNKDYDKSKVFYEIDKVYDVSLIDLANIIKSFKDMRTSLFIPNMNNELVNKLYSTYLSYLDPKDFSYPLLTHSDSRGSFSEIIKSNYFGQVSLNVSSAYEVKGEHWHHSKNEKFLVVKGKASIKFRNIFSDEVIEYIVSDKKLEVVDIPTGYTHNIANLLDTDLITIMWVNEPYNPNKPDTFYKKVEENE